MQNDIEALKKVRDAIRDLEGVEFPYDVIKRHIWPAQVHIDECIKKLEGAKPR